MMVADHSTASQRVEALAQQQGVSPEANAVSTMLKAESDALIAQLQQLTGSAFDRAYIDAQVLVHDKVLGIIDSTLLAAAVDANLRNELTTTRGAVAGHLQEAQQIQSTLVSDAGTDASTSRSDSGTTGTRGGRQPR
jgi:putative membrane protein